MTTLRLLPGALLPVLLLIAPAALAAPAAGAASGFWGEITGERQTRSNVNRAGTTIKTIDGSAVMERQPRVPPGMHTVIVHWTPKRGLRTSDRTLRLEVKPCKRYYVNAQFASPGSTLWQAVVDKVEDIAGCGKPVPAGAPDRSASAKG